MNKLSTKTKNDNTKKTKRRAYESLLLLLLTISLFITATFAWFTDSAFSKGNKVFAGNLYVDIIASEEELVERYNIENLDDIIKTKDHTTIDVIFEYANLGYERYTRTYPDPENPNETLTDYYYIITGTDASSVNLYNFEPGQVKKINVKYLNKGDLAFRAAGAIKIEYDEVNNEYKSYTGLETLNQQYKGDSDIYSNKVSLNYTDGELPPAQPEKVPGEYDVSMEGSKGKIEMLITIDLSGSIEDIEVIEQHEAPGDPDNYVSRLIGYNKGLYFGDEIKTLVNPDAASLNEAFATLINKAFVESGFGYVEDLSYYDTIDPKLVSEKKNIFNYERDYYEITRRDMDYKEYERRFNKLLNMQAIKSLDSISSLKQVQHLDNKKVASSYDNYYDNGGHLEDILEIYVGIDDTTDRDVFSNEDSDYYFGTLKQFSFLVENGPFSTSNYKLPVG